MPYAVTGDPVKKTGHMRFPGSVSISEETFGAVAKGVAVSAIGAGFRTVVLMGDHSGGQKSLQSLAEELNSEWSTKGVHVYYIPDLYYKSLEDINRYLKEHGLVGGPHAGMSDTSQVMFLDNDQKWIRKDRLVLGDSAVNGVDGDPRAATAELGRIFINIKIKNAVSQIHEVMSRSK
jgi:creatinine amidohydrolase/Fe(II)-dependent formamide hydrolase-like protein